MCRVTQLLQFIAAPLFDRIVYRVQQPGRSSAGSHTEAEDVHVRKIHCFNKVSADGEFGIGFSRKAYDDVSGNRHVWDRFSGRFYDGAEFTLAGAANHAPQCRITATLQRQMQMGTQARAVPETKESWRESPGFER